jgi:hypothetical protein
MHQVLCAIAIAHTAANTAAHAQVPMVFWGEQFWKDSCIYDALEKNSKDRPMHQWVSHTSIYTAYINECMDCTMCMYISV